jgi:hypothetical protein
MCRDVVATCCTGLLTVALLCNVLQLAALRWKLLHHIAKCRTALQRSALLQRAATCRTGRRASRRRRGQRGHLSQRTLCAHAYACVRAHARVCVLGLYVYRIALYDVCVCAHARVLPQGGLRARACGESAPRATLCVRKAWGAAGLAATLADNSHRRYLPRIV